MAVTYEWSLNQMDGEDVAELYFHDTLKAALSQQKILSGETAIELVRTESDGNDGMTDRQWAQLDGGRLPANFNFGAGELGALIPRRFHKECGA